MGTNPYINAPGSWQNASEKDCWKTCGACFRCENKDVNSKKCHNCSGRHNPTGHMAPDDEDFCACSTGVLRWRDKVGQLRITKYNKNPFKSSLVTETKTADEREWEGYLHDVREKMDNPNWTPIKWT